MAITTIIQGEDIALEFLLLDEESNPIDISVAECVEIIAIFISEQDPTAVLKKYSLTGDGGYGILEKIVGGDDNGVRVFVNREESLTFTLGNYSVAILPKFERSFPPDDQEIKEIQFPLHGIIKLGFGKEEYA